MLNVKTSTNTKTTLKVNTAGVLTAISEGTYTAIQAMYEFIDNSLDANGKNIRVGVYENNRCRGGTNVQSLVISDDGAGGNPAELQEALTIGGDCNRTTLDIGNFGIGMKAAAFALGDELTIVTKTQDGNVIGSYLNRKQINLDGTYEAHGDPNPTHDYQEIWDKWSLNSESGMIIVIESIKDKIMCITGKAFADQLRDRETLRSRYYYHLEAPQASRVNIEVSRNGRWSRATPLRGYDRLHLNSARDASDQNYNVLFDRALPRIQKYDDVLCRLRITEACSSNARTKDGSKDHGLGIYYNGVLICISSDWLGTRNGNQSWRTHIRGALIFDTKDEYNKVFSSSARKVTSIPVTGFGHFMAHSHFSKVLTESIARRREEIRREKGAKREASREQENGDFVRTALGNKRHFPSALLSYQSKINEIRKGNLNDAGIMGALTPSGVVEYNMDQPDISSLLSHDSPDRRRFGRALAVQDAIERDMETAGLAMSLSEAKAFLASLME